MSQIEYSNTKITMSVILAFVFAFLIFSLTLYFFQVDFVEISYDEQIKFYSQDEQIIKAIEEAKE